MSLLCPLIVPASDRVDQAVSIAFERSSPWPQAEADEIVATIRVFAEAGQRGGFPAPNVSPSQSSLAVGRVSLRDTLLMIELTAGNVDVRAFQLLRHMISRVPIADPDVLVRIEVLGTGSTRRPLPIVDNENEFETYPGVGMVQLQLLSDDSSEGVKCRRVLVDFSRSATPADVAALSPVTDAWAALLEGGAFAMPFALPAAVENVYGRLTQFDAFALEINAAIYKSSEAGFDVLCNMLDAANATVGGLRSITID